MDDDDTTLPNHLFISLRHEFQATRVIDARLSPTRIKLKVDISSLDDDTDEYAVRMEAALAKMSYFTEQVLRDVVIVYSDNEWAVNCFLTDDAPATSNMVMLCPDEPTDAMLCELLLCKFKALVQGAFEFHAIEIESTDARGMSFMFVGGNPGESFPSNEEWLTDRNFFSKPWWHRADASTMDVVPDEDADLNEPPMWAYSMGFIDDQMASPSSTADHKIVRPEFRPTVIPGGKAD